MCRSISRQRGRRILCSLQTLCAAALVFAGGAFAQESPPLRFERFAADKDLPSDSITTLLIDRTGFAWIGTRHGLVFFDGHETRVLQHDVADPRSLGDSSIRTLFEDSRGNLWVGTNAGGLNLLDRATWQVERFVNDPANATSISHDSVYAIAEDRNGTLWVGTHRGLNRFDRATRRFERIRGGLTNEHVMALAEDGAGRLWIATLGGGLDVRNPSSGAITAFRNDPSSQSTLSSDHVHALVTGTTGTLFVGTRNGIDLIDPDTLKLRRVITGDTVTALARDSHGGVWAGLLSGVVTRVRADDPPRNAALSEVKLDGGSIFALAVDQRGALWVGTWGGGIYRARTEAGLPRALPLTDAAGAQTFYDVMGVAEDEGGDLWIGAFGGGVMRRSSDGRIQRYLQDPSGVGQQDGVVDMRAGNDGSIWVGTMEGLHHIDPATGADRAIHHRAGDDSSLGPGFVTAVFEDRSNHVWVGTGGGGLHRLDRQRNVVERYSRCSGREDCLADDYITTIRDDSQGTIWIGTRSGLHAITPGSRRVERYLPDPTRAGALSHRHVTSILLDSKKRLWIGTGGGLNRLDRRSDEGLVTFAAFTARQGLIDDEVTAIVEDDDGSLWVSTRNGLSRFDPESHRFVSYDANDGLPSAEFNVATAHAGRSNLYFGTRRGVVVIPRGSRFPASAPSATRITGIQTPAGDVIGDRPAWEMGTVRIRYGEWLSLQFTTLDYDGPHRHRFSYRLAGDDSGDRWVELGKRRELTLQRLPPGRYTFEVLARNSRGAMSTTPRPLVIEVAPPFWMTPWFRIAAVLALLAIGVGVHLARTAALRRRNARLVALHAEKEAAYERIRQMTRLLEGVKEEERRHIGRELHDELGQALTAAKIGIHLAGTAPAGDAARKRLADTTHLIDGMIERVRALSLDLRPPLLDELGLVPSLKAYSELVSKRTDVVITCNEKTRLPALDKEIEIAAYRVAQEALTNALRHARPSRIDIDLASHDGEIEVTIRDDGEGFDVASVSARRESLGLVGMRERAAMLGGTLLIKSSPGGGTVVTAHLPAQEGGPDGAPNPAG